VFCLYSFCDCVQLKQVFKANTEKSIERHANQMSTQSDSGFSSKKNQQAVLKNVCLDLLMEEVVSKEVFFPHFPVFNL